MTSQSYQTFASLTIFTAFIGLSVLLSPAKQAECQEQKVTAEIDYKGNTFSGLPLGWDGKRVALLGQDGKLSFIPIASQDELKIVAQDFKPYSVQQLQTALQREFGDRYTISATQRFAVAHPWGDADIWATPFEDFHRRFVDFFESRGLKLDKPATPMMAIVLRSRADFDRYLLNEVNVPDARIVGYYSRFSNRITTYNPSGKIRVNKDRWIYRAGPIIHEATHQSAFNTGIHNRYAPPPKWLSEGLATLFEARGFNHASKYRKIEDRINKERLKQLRRHLASGHAGAGLLHLINSDRIFQTNTELAYALSWGLSFYLIETRPDDYFEYLKRDSKRAPFAAYPSAARRKDFVSVFGNDLEKIENEMTQFFLSR